MKNREMKSEFDPSTLIFVGDWVHPKGLPKIKARVVATFGDCITIELFSGTDKGQKIEVERHTLVPIKNLK